ncbi:hypothetical protein CYMTET_3996 [Cymbomonas tetramitiformis]|uniref:X8 domain-containing protein n=1 Tax=Cymbomonas tetramitiformis TaxID=36881 RepID=A0AAE0LKU4_9CHLO|nr:hypothetical protein CYMTET_3996 [Cymbomonas tetramitiformis]
MTKAAAALKNLIAGHTSLLHPTLEKVTAHKFSAVPKGLTCHLKKGMIKEQVLDDLIGYICSTGVDCSPIQPGGSKYPCDVKDCANYAANAYFQKNYPTVEYAIDTTCFFKGIAETNPRPQHFFMATTTRALVMQDNDVNVVNDVAKLAPGRNYRYAFKNVTLKYDAAVSKTFFQGIWVARSASDSNTCKITCVVRYDFNGNGTFDRTETYAPWVMGVSPAYQNYNSGVIPAPGVVGTYLEDMTDGTVELSLSKPIRVKTKEPVMFLQATSGGPPASITIPFK